MWLHCRLVYCTYLSRHCRSFEGLYLVILFRNFVSLVTIVYIMKVLISQPYVTIFWWSKLKVTPFLDKCLMLLGVDTSLTTVNGTESARLINFCCCCWPRNVVLLLTILKPIYNQPLNACLSTYYNNRFSYDLLISGDFRFTKIAFQSFCEWLNW
jgi:hypothetical protein